MPHDISINTIIGENTFIKGEIKINGTLRIDGGFLGNISSQGRVYIGKNGKVEGELFSKIITVGGVVKGNLYADGKVDILKTAQIYGNIFTSSINISDGVIFDGDCRVLTAKEMSELMIAKKKELNI